MLSLITILEQPGAKILLLKLLNPYREVMVGFVSFKCSRGRTKSISSPTL